jgi:hypothetical protein
MGVSVQYEGRKQWGFQVNQVKGKRVCFSFSKRERERGSGMSDSGLSMNDSRRPSTVTEAFYNIDKRMSYPFSQRGFLP